MKCRYCGAEVGLEENFCSYCGKPNDQAIRHSREMASFHRRYAATEAAVVSKANRYSQVISRAVLILVMLIATVVMAAVTENAYSLPEAMRSREAGKHPEQTCAVLDAYLESGDYRSFSSYITYNGIRTYGTVFEKYTNVSWCADAYSSFVLHLESLFLQTDRDRWLQYSASSDIRWLCQSLDDFLDDYESAQRNEESELYLGYIEDMRQTMGQMLHVYLGIDEQELAEFLTLSENRKAVYVEEVLLNAQKAG